MCGLGTIEEIISLTPDDVDNFEHIAAQCQLLATEYVHQLGAQRGGGPIGFGPGKLEAPKCSFNGEMPWLGCPCQGWSCHIAARMCRVFTVTASRKPCVAPSGWIRRTGHRELPRESPGIESRQRLVWIC